MTYEVLYENRGDRWPLCNVALVTNDKDKAFEYCRKLSGPLAQAIHYAITSEDGVTHWNTKEKGLL
jgi:hypothetical protein